MFSVVIPACNEAPVIGRTLRTLLESAAPGELDVVVVCNGCTDDTAQLARAFAPSVRVIETSEASKANALNLGDEAARSFPRFYLDADVQVRADDLRAMAQVLDEDSNAQAATSALKMDVAESPWTVRAYHRIWAQLPAIRHGLVGRGVYGVSEAGRRRFERFPEVIADDLFMQLLFDDASRRCVASCTSIVEAPRSLSGLLQRKTRSYLGNCQLRRSSLPGPSSARGDSTAWLGVLVGDPRRAVDAPVYVAVTLVARARAWWRFRQGDLRTWDRDDTTRSRTEPHSGTVHHAGPASVRGDDGGSDEPDRSLQ